MSMSVLLNLIDAEAMEEMDEAEAVIASAGGQNPVDRLILLRQVFSVGRPMGRRETLPMGRVPTVGEYICLPMEKEVWYRVEIVLHTPGHPAHVAEIWALEESEADSSIS